MENYKTNIIDKYGSKACLVCIKLLDTKISQAIAKKQNINIMILIIQ
jgi:hypothetical protein